MGTRRPLRQLIVSREFPPASYPSGGIGTYVAHIAELLADSGDSVHVIGERWSGAPEAREERLGGRLVVHRVALDHSGPETREATALRGTTPARRFAWQAAQLAEHLIEREEIDLIEAQEWEAPLYFYLLRRRLGLGPRRKPPCIVHFHSPSEFIYRHNDWTGRPEYLSATRFEEYCIRSADAWLCPSKYLARQVAARYEIPVDAIAIIPYPVGDSGWVTGDSRTREERILYVGRLEPRKGVIEFIDAAVEVAKSHGTVSFDFVGDDVRFPGTVTVRRYMEARIPRPLRSRFRFHGVVPRPRLSEFFARARASAVPSRWENFPNTCIESMASGVPVIASPTGGMVEMLEDEVTGWIAPGQTIPDLVLALRRALAASSEQCVSMGRAAADSIQKLCGNETVTRSHLAFRREVAERGHVSGPSAGAGISRGVAAVERKGLAIIVQAVPGSRSGRAIDSIARLTPRPNIVTEIGERQAPSAAALSLAIRKVVVEHGVAGVALVPASLSLEPHFVEKAEAALQHVPGMGVLCGWVDGGTTGFAQPSPAFPYQWVWDGIGAAAVVRSEAFLEAGGLREDLPLEYARWDLWNAILLSGWEVLAYPGVLASAGDPATTTLRDDHEALLGRLRNRFATAFARDAGAVALLETLPRDEAGSRLRDVFRLEAGQQLSLAFDAMRRPRQAFEWLRSQWRGAGQ